ncbi:MAG: EAL domain-containing protein [Clostridia bacterium]|nr:EAL domain-containing protein [Clostridia bacterium]
MSNELELYILDHFQSAMDREYIQPYYQPVIRTISRQLCSFEALARWIDPERGMIYPDQFIPVLEQNNLIHLLDTCIIRQVCARIRRTVESGSVPVPVSINLSRLDFELCDIFQTVDGIATEYQIPHDFLYIEITESVMAEQEGHMQQTIARFRNAGYQVWMDDFGSAYSSLNILKDCEFNEIKLDMKFLSSFNQRSRQILTAVIQMGKEIGIHTLAEGVETLEQVRYLRNIGCEKVQGYYYGKPMPYNEAMRHLKNEDIPVEHPQDRKYYDDIGRVNFLSAVPFMTQEERDAIKTARALNNIPLALAEGRRESFSILFYNTAFENTADSTGMVSDIFRQEMLRVPQPYSLLPKRLLNLMESTKSGEEGRMYFISNDEYYEIQAKCVAQTKDAYSVLFRMSNLSKASQMSKTNLLDESIRQLYTLFERVTIIDARTDTIKPLYVATREDLLSGRQDIKKLAEEFAKQWIFPEDRSDYLELMDFSTVEERLHKSGRTYVSKYLRSRIRHGQYAWKKYILLRLHTGIYAELIRNVHEDLLAFKREDRFGLVTEGDEKTYSPERLWQNLIRSDIVRLFWKDKARRFLGANRGFLDYYGFASVDDIIGKTDEDLGWHVHPDSFMNDELSVIHEGITTHNVPGRCMNNGENRDIIASKSPLFDENGEVRGLIGAFIDKDLLTVNDTRGKETKRRDILTGLLNSRGITEEAHTFEDEYNLRNVDFVRMHVAIDDFPAVNKQYGFDFGDKAITVLGRALKKAFGRTCAVGRYTGHQFVILHQIHSEEEAEALRKQVKQIASDIRQIDGIALTLYLSVGTCIYSECLDLEEQGHKAEVRLLADHSMHTTTENLLSKASEMFHLYDDLPIAYAVFKVLENKQHEVHDAVMYYANHAFERESRMSAAEMLGRRMTLLFPGFLKDWYQKAHRAAFGGETIAGQMIYPPNGKMYYVTISPVIHNGYCCFTYQDLNTINIQNQD